jgi:hypothetical protein
MIWIVDSFTTHLFLRETACLLDVPIRVEIEFQLKSRTVRTSSITKKAYYNRPLLIAEGRSKTPEELDSLIERTVAQAIKNHLGHQHGLALEESPPA